MIEDVVLMKDLTDHERLMFQHEMGTRRKNPTTGLLLCLFLGGLGAHRFYLGQTGLGILYACFVWTFVPALVALVECFLIMNRVRIYNDAVALEVTTKLKALRPGAESALPASPTATSSQPKKSRALAAAAGAAAGATAVRAADALEESADTPQVGESVEEDTGGLSDLAGLLDDE